MQHAPLPSASWKSAAAAVFLFAGTEPAFSPALQNAAPWLKDSPGLADFRAAKGEALMLYGPQSSPMPRILLLGLGQSKGPLEDTLYALRDAAAKASRLCREARLPNFAFSLPDLAALDKDAAVILREAVFGALAGLYRQTQYKSAKALASDAADPELLLLCEEELSPDLAAALDEAEAGAEGVIWAKELINGPANRITPAYLAEEAERFADASPDVSCRTLGPGELRSEGMGALLAVAKGSATPPRLVVLDYAPEGHENDDPLVLIGKGLTFDSGGLCLKPGKSMVTMKEDMSGAAAVLGVFKALARLRPQCRIAGLLPCVENMPGPSAARPGDVAATLAGHTVEITNTDAEGRLVLCDALAYAQKIWHPRAMVDIATLTGACVVALGQHTAGAFSRDPLLPERILDIGRTVGERFWPLPLWDLYFEGLKSQTADFANSGPREGGACIAAAFLAKFVEPDIRWIHLDIAGPAFFTEEGKKEASGFAVRTLLHFALQK